METEICLANYPFPVSFRNSNALKQFAADLEVLETMKIPLIKGLEDKVEGVSREISVEGLTKGQENLKYHVEDYTRNSQGLKITVAYGTYTPEQLRELRQLQEA